jgi:hypothetical protein
MNKLTVPAYIIAAALLVIAAVQVVTIDRSDVRSHLAIVDSVALPRLQPLAVYASDTRGTPESIEFLCNLSGTDFIVEESPKPFDFRNRFGHALPIIQAFVERFDVEPPEMLFPPTSISGELVISFRSEQAEPLMPPFCERRAIEEARAGRVICIMDRVFTTVGGAPLGVDFRNVAFLPTRSETAVPTECPIKPRRTWRVVSGLIIQDS